MAPQALDQVLWLIRQPGRKLNLAPVVERGQIVEQHLAGVLPDADLAQQNFLVFLSIL